MKENKTYFDAGTIARERFETYLAGKLSESWDTTEWEFYSFLLEQAKNHSLDLSGFGPVEYQRDRDEARQRNKQIQEPQKTMPCIDNVIFFGGKPHEHRKDEDDRSVVQFD